MKKVVYGLALPTVRHLIFLYDTRLSLIYTSQIIVSGVVVGHVACKTVYVRIFRGSDHIHESSLMSLGVLVWVIIALVIWIISGDCHVNSRVQQPIKSYRMFSSCLVSSLYFGFR